MSLIFLLSPEKLDQITLPVLQEWGGKLGFSQIYVLHPSTLNQLPQLPQIPLIYIKDTDDLSSPELVEEPSPPKEYGERKIYVLVPPPKSPSLDIKKSHRSHIQTHLISDLAGIVESYGEYEGVLIKSFNTQDLKLSNGDMFKEVQGMQLFPDEKGDLHLYVSEGGWHDSQHLLKFDLQGQILLDVVTGTTKTHFVVFRDNNKTKIFIDAYPINYKRSILDKDFKILSNFTFRRGTEKVPLGFGLSHSIVYHNEIYLFSAGNSNIQVYDLNENFRREFSVKGSTINGIAILEGTNRLAISSPDNGILIVDALDPSKGVLQVWNSRGERKDQFGELGPQYIVSDSSKLYIKDHSKNRIVIFNFKGIYLGEVRLDEDNMPYFSVYGDILVVAYYEHPKIRVYQIVL